MTPADTVTVYAAQGSTYDAVIVDMQRPPRLNLAKHWLACYVMISRATSLGGFLVLRPATRKELSSKPPQYLIDELDRLLRLEDKSYQELIAYIDSLEIEIPSAIQEILDPQAARRQVEDVKAA